MGTGSMEKLEMVCFLPASERVKSAWERSAAGFPFFVFAATGTSTSSTRLRSWTSCAGADVPTIQSARVVLTAARILGRIVSSSRTNPDVRIFGKDLDSAECSVARKVVGPVRQTVLSSQFESDLFEHFLEVAGFTHSEKRAAGVFSHSAHCPRIPSVG